jgi:hypothetical protein
MSCRRLRRELVELVRFGEIDRRSAPHLEHLAGCRECREEVGFDRAFVQHMRTVLAERVDDASPSSAAWPIILARAQAGDRGLHAWLREHAVTFVGRLRTATAISAMAVAALLLVRTDITIPQAEAAPAPGGRTASQSLARYALGHGLSTTALAGGTAANIFLARQPDWQLADAQRPQIVMHPRRTGFPGVDASSVTTSETAEIEASTADEPVTNVPEVAPRPPMIPPG